MSVHVADGFTYIQEKSRKKDCVNAKIAMSRTLIKKRLKIDVGFATDMLNV